MEFKNSLATKLLMVTFSLYFVVTLTVTLLHIGAEYFQSRNYIQQELGVIQQSYIPSLAQSLWDFDLEQIHATSVGLLRFSAIKGVQIKNEQGKLISGAGLVLNDAGDAVEVDSTGHLKDKVIPIALFLIKSPIRNLYEENKDAILGEMILYSSEEIIWERVKLGLYFIIGNAIVKTAALWLLFFWAFRQFLGKPLAKATQLTQDVNFNNLEGLLVNWGIKGRNELKQLEDAFNAMLQKLNHTLTERQQAEDSLRESDTNLRQLKHYLDNIINSMPSTLIGLDADENVTLWNLQAEKETNIQSVEAIGKPLSRVYPAILDQKSKIQQSLETNKVLIAEQIEDSTQEELRYRDMTFYPLVAEGTQGVVLRIDDVTHKVQLEHLTLETREREIREQEQLRYQKEIEETNDELKSTINHLEGTQKKLVQSEKMAALGRLVTGVAHEINTPLGIGITGSTYIRHRVEKINKSFKKLEMKQKDFENFLEVITETSISVETSLLQVAELVENFKQVSSDQASFIKKEFNLSSYLETILSSLSSQLDEDEYPTIVMNCEHDLTIYSYPGAFLQVISHLVQNTFTHGFEKGRPGTITFDVTQEKENLIVQYNDNGCGISEENLSKIFDPFFTTQRGTGMVGLGLHIAYNLVHDKLGGSIRCESTLKEGTTFTLVLPMKVEDSE